MEDRNREEKQEGRRIVLEKGRFLSWLDNFWYHYKWHTVAVCFVLLILLVCFVQCGSRETGDVTFAYAGDCNMTQSEYRAFVDSLDALALKKEGEDGTVTVVLNNYAVYTEAEEEKLRALYKDKDGNFDNLAFQNAWQQSKSNLQTFGDLVMSGQTALYFVSESVYKYQNLEKLAAPLSDYFETPPAAAYGDGYAIRLADTEFYKYYEALHFLPENTLVVLTKPYIFGTTSDETTYQYFEDLFLGVVNFKAP